MHAIVLAAQDLSGFCDWEDNCMDPRLKSVQSNVSSFPGEKNGVIARNCA